MSEKKIRLVVGFALLITAFFMVATSLEWIQGGGEAIGLQGGKLAIAVIVNFGLGALMTAGIGLYAPCMALVFALGMSPQVAFPIMMGSCAFLMPPASVLWNSSHQFAHRGIRRVSRIRNQHLIPFIQKGHTDVHDTFLRTHQGQNLRSNISLNFKL